MAKNKGRKPPAKRPVRATKRKPPATPEEAKRAASWLDHQAMLTPDAPAVPVVPASKPKAKPKAKAKRRAKSAK